MAAMTDTDEDAELALLGSEEDDEQTLRRFLDALPRDTESATPPSRPSSPDIAAAKLLLRRVVGRRALRPRRLRRHLHKK